MIKGDLVWTRSRVDDPGGRFASLVPVDGDMIPDALIKAYEHLDCVAQIIAGAEETGRISAKGHDALRECVFEIARLKGVE